MEQTCTNTHARTHGRSPVINACPVRLRRQCWTGPVEREEGGQQRAFGRTADVDSGGSLVTLQCTHRMRTFLKLFFLKQRRDFDFSSMRNGRHRCRCCRETRTVFVLITAVKTHFPQGRIMLGGSAHERIIEAKQT